MSKFQFFAVCASLVCWCVFIINFFVVLAIQHTNIFLDYIAAGSVIGGVLFFASAIIFNKEGKK
jgi:hypothetical protein